MLAELKYDVTSILATQSTDKLHSDDQPRWQWPVYFDKLLVT